MRADGFECKQCGRCCKVLGLEYDLVVTEQDVRRWRREGRRDILAWVGQAVFVGGYEFPVDPRTGDEVEGACPFLRKVPGRPLYLCGIHDTKPGDCVRFPACREDAAAIDCAGYG